MGRTEVRVDLHFFDHNGREGPAGVSSQQLDHGIPVDLPILGRVEGPHIVTCFHEREAQGGEVLGQGGGVVRPGCCEY